MLHQPSTDHSVVCFGEVLWDLFPSGPVAGGAPMNVAIRLASLGIRSSVISAVGADTKGNELLSLLRSRSVDTSLIGVTQDLPTGSVVVTIASNGSPSFEIVSPSAWDAIDADERSLRAVRSADALVFGSLACRSARSRDTLLRLLNEAQFTVFDVNLRPPFVDRSLIDELLRRSDLIKMNDEELRVLCSDSGSSGEREMMEWCAEQSGAETVCITRGERGAIVLHQGKWAEHPGFTVAVADTVGAGDSFLAGFLDGMFRELSLQETLTRACAIGALVASRPGAIPEIGHNDIEQIIGTELR